MKTNGPRKRPPEFASREPLAAVLELGRGGSAIAIALLVAFLLHGTAAARAAMLPIEMMQWSKRMGQRIHDRLWETYDIDLAKAPPPEPEPPPPPAPEPEPAKAAEPPPPHAEPKEPPPPPPPAAAQAGAVLTAPEDTKGPVVDFTQGSAASFAGGVTQSGGTSATPVYNPNARAGGVPGGTGTGPAVPQPPPGPDRSRVASVGGSGDWKCPWPQEADAEQIDEAYVSVQVMTNADGTAARVTVLTDPGHGFGREARQCAMREHYTTALDHDGRPIPGVTRGFRIHFER